MEPEWITIELAEARDLAMRACRACGASDAVGHSLVKATLSAELEGKPGLGFPHFFDYLSAMKEGRIDPAANPVITNPLPAIIHCDAADGIAQLGFDLAIDRLQVIASSLGVCIFTLGNSYTAGEIGYYVRRLAKAGFMSIAMANAHALMAASPGGRKVFSTNPLAFGVPLGAGEAPLVIDQASSATAFVNILRAAKAGEAIPEGWATDSEGNATTDPAKAASGALLPFGGYKGANIALMVEMLAAGYSGASWSIDVGSFNSGNTPPRSGMTIIILKPDSVDPRFMDRSLSHLQRMAKLGLRRPGGWASHASGMPVAIGISSGVLSNLRRYSEVAK